MKEIDCKTISEKLDERTKTLIENGKSPMLSITIVGEDGASVWYAKSLSKKIKGLGGYVMIHQYSSDVPVEDVAIAVEAESRSRTVDGIMFMSPMPTGYQERLLSHLNPSKDVDGATPENMGKLILGQPIVLPPTVRAILEIVHQMKYNGHLGRGHMRAVVVNRSAIIGKPLAVMLAGLDFTVTLAHSRTANLKELCSEADLLVVATGQAGMFTSEYIKEGAVVIDAGTAVVDGKLRGDVDVSTLEDRDCWVTPVPGGVGTVTTSVTAHQLAMMSSPN